MATNTQTKPVLTAAQLAAKAKLDAARAEFNASIGKTSKPRNTGFAGFTGAEMVTVVNPTGPGFTTAEQHAIAKRIGKGMSMADLLALDMPGLDGMAWVKYRLIGGAIRLNGYSVTEAFAAVAAQPTGASVAADLTK